MRQWPWTMTRAAYIRLRAKPKPSMMGDTYYTGDVNQLSRRHAQSVATALANGKQVSAEVLADYPNLAPTT